MMRRAAAITQLITDALKNSIINHYDEDNRVHIGSNAIITGWEDEVIEDEELGDLENLIIHYKNHPDGKEYYYTSDYNSMSDFIRRINW